MLLLFETAAGYAVFKVDDDKSLQEVNDLGKAFEDSDYLHSKIQLEKFVKFEDTKDALASSADLVEGKISKRLKKLLKKLYVKELRDDVLAIADKKLCQEITQTMDIPSVSDSNVQKLMRAIRMHQSSLLPDLGSEELTRMQLGLAHSIDRYKLKCNPDKIDTMIVQAVGLLDELDKEANNYLMRCREMYGWHFPELSKIVQDNTTYVKLVRFMGIKENSATMDLSDLVPDEIASQIRAAAIISLGTEITEEDLTSIYTLCDQILEIYESRESLYDYLFKRMVAVAPNLTALVGEVLGARLIAKAGTLVNLAKYPASTVQILGAEKALFRAMKARHNTPKYGLMYHATMITNASSELKGKVSRSLAAKTSLAIRIDALGDEDASKEMGIKCREMLEKRIRELESNKGTVNLKRKSSNFQNNNQAKKFKKF